MRTQTNVHIPSFSCARRNQKEKLKVDCGLFRCWFLNGERVVYTASLTLRKCIVQKIFPLWLSFKNMISGASINDVFLWLINPYINNCFSQQFRINCNVNEGKWIFHSSHSLRTRFRKLYNKNKKIQVHFSIVRNV